MARREIQTPSSSSPQEPFWRRNRREITFLVLFVVLLGGGFTLISVNWVNDHAIEPFTAGIARVSGAALDLLGQNVTHERHDHPQPALRGEHPQRLQRRRGDADLPRRGARLPRPWSRASPGSALGILAIQIVNLMRVVALFLTGVYFPKLFDTSHTVIWQTIVILSGVAALDLLGEPLRPPPPAEPAA